MTDPLTEMLASLKEKLRAATPAPWTASEEVPGAIEITDPRLNQPVNLFGLDIDGMAICSHKPDAAYLAALDPETVAALIGCVEAASVIRNEWNGKNWGDLDRALAQLRKLAEGRRG